MPSVLEREKLSKKGTDTSEASLRAKTCLSLFLRPWPKMLRILTNAYFDANC